MRAWCLGEREEELTEEEGQLLDWQRLDSVHENEEIVNFHSCFPILPLPNTHNYVLQVHQTMYFYHLFLLFFHFHCYYRWAAHIG